MGMKEISEYFEAFLQNFECKRIRVSIPMQLVDWADNTNRRSSLYIIFAVC